MNVLISTKPLIICLEVILVGVTVWTAVSLSAEIPLGTSTKRADFLKERITVGSCLFKDAVPAISSWLRSFPILRRQPRSLSSVSGHPACWSCIRGWFMRSSLCPACHGYPVSTPSQGIKMHEGSTNLRLLQELRSATNLALRATEVIAQSLGKAMSTLVDPLWLSLVERAKSTKYAFSKLSAPRLDCSATLSRTVPSSSRQYWNRLVCFSTGTGTFCPGVMHRRANPSLLVAVGALLCPPKLLRPELDL